MMKIKRERTNDSRCSKNTHTTEREPERVSPSALPSVDTSVSALPELGLYPGPNRHQVVPVPLPRVQQRSVCGVADGGTW